MITLKETSQKIAADPKWWKLYFYDFVDEFRRFRKYEMIAESFDLSDDQTDALLASTVENLCDELKIKIPAWTRKIPACRQPYFVAGLENLKAAAIVQSPLRYKVRNVFVTESFLFRV